MGMEPESYSLATSRMESLLHTHCDHDTKQPAHDSIDTSIQIFVRRLRTIHSPVRLLAHAKTEQVWFGHDEIQILVVYACNMLRSPCSGYLGGKIFEKRPRYRREEVDVGRGVKTTREIGGDDL